MKFETSGGTLKRAAEDPQPREIFEIHSGKSGGQSYFMKKKGNDGRDYFQIRRRNDKKIVLSIARAQPEAIRTTSL
jgi:hypothetical protein